MTTTLPPRVLGPDFDMLTVGAGTTFKSIDDCLGPRAGRFFGEGFRGVRHRITDVAMCSPAAGNGQLTAKASFSYPPGWSTKQTDSELRPHVSGIDALVIAVQLAEMYLTDTYRLDRPRRRRMWLRRCAIKAPAPQEDLVDVDVRAVNVGRRPEPTSLCGQVSTFSCDVGSLKVTCEIEHEAPQPAAPHDRPTWTRSADDILGAAATRYYGEGYKRRRHSITDLEVDDGNRYVQGLVRVLPVGMDASADDGLGAGYGPSLTMVDCFLTLGQLVQVLVYRLDGIGRGHSNTLWLRTLRMECQTPYQPMLNSFTAALALTRSQTVPMADGVWRSFGASGQFQGIRFDVTCAHQLPADALGRVAERAGLVRASESS